MIGWSRQTVQTVALWRLRIRMYVSRLINLQILCTSILALGGAKLRSLVKAYVLVRGNHESTEVLQDYVDYLHKLGCVIRRQPTVRRRTNSHRKTR